MGDPTLANVTTVEYVLGGDDQPLTPVDPATVNPLKDPSANVIADGDW